MDKILNLIKRGTLEIISEAELLKKLKSKKPLLIKWGADPSAPDLHLGHAVVIRKLKQFQDLGHQVIFLIGDFTGMIGDPSGRSQTRRALTAAEVKKNSRTYQKQIFKILDAQKTRLMFNRRWLSKMSLADAVKLAGKYTVARMLERDDFARRFKSQQPISVHEFLYPFLQAYDSVYLKADIEIGGSDQKFNLLLGREIQRAFGLDPQIVITLPLLEGTDGKLKMSKSYGNYIGITEPPGEIFGKIMSISDDLMYRYFELLTDEDLGRIKKLHPQAAKKLLGKSIVTMFYDKEKAAEAEVEFEKIFEEREIPADLKIFKIKRGEVFLAKLLFETGLAVSGSSARRLIQQGGIRVNDKVVRDEKARISIDQEIILKAGKRRFVKVQPC